MWQFVDKYLVFFQVIEWAGREAPGRLKKSCSKAIAFVQQQITDNRPIFWLMSVSVFVFMVTCLLSILTRRTLSSMAEPGIYSAAYVTVPNEEVAKKIAHGVVSAKLAACVNIIPKITSVYEWEGKIEEDSEFLLMLKTRTSKVDALTKFVKENHPYKVCEVISLPIQNGNPDYFKWMSDVIPA